MSEQPETSTDPENRVAKPVPGPWRWGYWKLHKDSEEIEFRPLSEVEEVNPISGIFHFPGPFESPRFPNIELSHREFGFRCKANSSERAWAPKSDGGIDESQPFEVVTALRAPGSEGLPTVQILATKPVRDLIAAAPETAAQRDQLLAACEAALIEIKAAIASGEVVSPSLKRWLEAAIASTKGDASEPKSTDARRGEPA